MQHELEKLENMKLELVLHRLVFPGSSSVSPDEVRWMVVARVLPFRDKEWHIFPVDSWQCLFEKIDNSTNGFESVEQWKKDLGLLFKEFSCGSFSIGPERVATVDSIMWGVTPESCCNEFETDAWRGITAAAFLAVSFRTAKLHDATEMVLTDAMQLREGGIPGVRHSVVCLARGKRPFYEKFGFTYDGIADIDEMVEHERLQAEEAIPENQELYSEYGLDDVLAEVKEAIDENASTFVARLPISAMNYDGWLAAIKAKHRGTRMPSRVDVIATVTTPSFAPTKFRDAFKTAMKMPTLLRDEYDARVRWRGCNDAWRDLEAAVRKREEAGKMLEEALEEEGKERRRVASMMQKLEAERWMGDEEPLAKQKRLAAYVPAAGLLPSLTMLRL